jgi:hypothetical protein
MPSLGVRLLFPSEGRIKYNSCFVVSSGKDMECVQGVICKA